MIVMVMAMETTKTEPILMLSRMMVVNGQIVMETDMEIIRQA